MIGKMLIGFIESEEIKNKNMFIKSYWVHHVTVNALLGNKFFTEKNKPRVWQIKDLVEEVYNEFDSMNSIDRAIAECIFLHFRRNGTSR